VGRELDHLGGATTARAGQLTVTRGDNGESTITSQRSRSDLEQRQQQAPVRVAGRHRDRRVLTIQAAIDAPATTSGGRAREPGYYGWS
jgi:hypothetical protein